MSTMYNNHDATMPTSAIQAAESIPQHVSAKTLADRLSLTRRQVYRLAEQHDIPSTRVGGRLLFRPDRVMKALGIDGAAT